jgi:hypothetical protein
VLVSRREVRTLVRSDLSELCFLCELRALISYRWRLVKTATAIQNRMHSLLHRHNLQAPEGKIDTAENRVWWEQVQLSELERLRLNQELKTLRLVREHIAQIEQELGRLSTSERWRKQATHIMQLPGVGIVVTTPALHHAAQAVRCKCDDPLGHW